MRLRKRYLGFEFFLYAWGRGEVEKGCVWGFFLGCLSFWVFCYDCDE
jgi:hypothetical protein